MFLLRLRGIYFLNWPMSRFWIPVSPMSSRRPPPVTSILIVCTHSDQQTHTHIVTRDLWMKIVFYLTLGLSTPNYPPLPLFHLRISGINIEKHYFSGASNPDRQLPSSIAYPVPIRKGGKTSSHYKPTCLLSVVFVVNYSKAARTIIDNCFIRSVWHRCLRCFSHRVLSANFEN